MKKQTKPKKTSVADFVKTIDTELNVRESSLNSRESKLNDLRDSISKSKVEFDATVASFNKEKADFEVASQEVNYKFAKIRSDADLTKALRGQALEAKQLEVKHKDVTEKLALVEIKLKEVEKRELALSKRESGYKDEIKKEFASNLFKA